MDPYTKRVVSPAAQLRNISKHGFSLTSEDSVTRGVRYAFEIMLLAGAVVTVEGKIAHLKIESVHYHCGVRIESIPFGERGRFNRFLSSQSKAIRQEFLVNSLVVGVVVGLALKFLPGLTWVVAGGLSLVAATVFFLWLPF